MSGLLILRALLFAGECFLATLLLPVLAFAAAGLLRRRAAMRHLVWTTMFGVLAVLPLAALLLPPRRIVEHVAAPTVIDAAPAMAPIAAAPPPSLMPSPGDLLTPENIVALLVALWLAGICWQLLRLSVGGLGLLRLRRASAPFAAPVQTGMDCPKGCEVRLSPGEDGPSTFGILRPIVLLPRSALGWPAARLEAVLRHEAAHVARRDTLSQFIARLVCAAFWPNPLLWLAARSLRRDAEIAADDEVLAGGMTPSLYAAELVGLAAEKQGTLPGIAMAGPPLAQRVQAVLANNSSRKGVTKMDLVKTATLGLAATLMLGVARLDIAVAQDAAPAPKVEKNVEVDVQNNVELNVRRNEDADAAAMSGTRARNVELDAAANSAAFAARAATIKAGADAVTAKAKAKAAAETDPAKREQYRKDAAQVAADSEKLKANADRLAASAKAHLAEVRQRMQTITSAVAEARQRAGDDRREAEARAKDMIREAPLRAQDMRREAQQRLAEARERAGGADRTESGESYTLTTRQAPPVGGSTAVTGVSGPDAGGNYTLQFGKPGDGPANLTIAPRAPGARTNGGPIIVLPADRQRAEAAMKAARDSLRSMGEIGPTVVAAVAKALADAHVSEEVTKALADAHIDQAIAQELEKARPEIEGALARARREYNLTLPPPSAAAPIPPARRALPVPPAPPPPAN